MEKVVFIAFAIDDAPSLDPGATRRFNEELLRSLDPIIYPEVSLQVEDGDATMRWMKRVRPLARRVGAVLSTWTECADNAGDVEAAIARLSDDYAGYVVTESVPRWQTDRSASAVEARPGVLVTSLLCRAPLLTRDEFVAHWRLVHQPMSLRIHPQWTYVRNVVARVLTPDAPEIDALCEEGFAHVDDVIDPARFYGGDVSHTTWKENGRTIGNDVPLFLDTTHTSSTITREYRLRTFRG